MSELVPPKNVLNGNLGCEFCLCFLTYMSLGNNAVLDL